MLSQLWSDPFIMAVVGLIVVLVIGVILACVEIYRDGRASGVTTAAELRKDAQAAERRKNLRTLQGRALHQHAYRARQDIRDALNEKAPRNG